MAKKTDEAAAVDAAAPAAAIDAVEMNDATSPAGVAVMAALGMEVPDVEAPAE